MPPDKGPRGTRGAPEPLMQVLRRRRQRMAGDEEERKYGGVRKMLERHGVEGYFTFGWILLYSLRPVSREPNLPFVT